MPSLPSKFLLVISLTILGLTSGITQAFAGEEEANRFYEQASEAYQAGDFAGAADLLERAYAEAPNLIYQYNRILALQGMERYAEALRVLDIYQNPMREDGRFDDIDDLERELHRALADAEQSAAAPAPDVDSAPDAAPAAAESIEPIAPPMPSRRRILGWSLVGAGGLAALIGAPFYTEILLNRRLDADPQADEPTIRRNHQIVSVVALVSAFGSAGAGAYILWTDRADDPSSAQLTITPQIPIDGVGGSLTVSF